VLSISVPVGIGEANRDVNVVVETLDLDVQKAADMTPDDHPFDFCHVVHSGWMVVF
jgi:hypothetical protein